MTAGRLLCWNVRGLNTKAHRDAVRDLVRTECASFVCIQETKLDVISNFDIVQILGIGFEYFYLPTIETRGASWSPGKLPFGQHHLPRCCASRSQPKSVSFQPIRTGGSPPSMAMSVMRIGRPSSRSCTRYVMSILVLG
jgi:hypothetical protein